MFTYFQEKLKIFQSCAQYRRERGGITNKKHAAALQRKPARREKKGDPQAGQRGRLFAAGLSVAACFFSCHPFRNGYLCLPFERMRFGLFLGVSLSATRSFFSFLRMRKNKSLRHWRDPIYV